MTLTTAHIPALKSVINAASSAADIDAALYEVGDSLSCNSKAIKALDHTAARYNGPQGLRARRKMMAARSARTWQFHQASIKIDLLKAEAGVLKTLDRLSKELQKEDTAEHRTAKRLAINLLKQIIDSTQPAALSAEARKEDRMIRLLESVNGGTDATALGYILALAERVWAEEVAAEKNGMRRYFMPTMLEENERLVKVRAGEFLAGQSKITLHVTVKAEDDNDNPVKVTFTYDAAAPSDEQTKALLEFATTYGLKFYRVEARHAKMVRQTRQMGLIVERFEGNDGTILGDDEGTVPKIRTTVPASEWMNNAHPRDARYWYVNGTYAMEGETEIDLQPVGVEYI